MVRMIMVIIKIIIISGTTRKYFNDAKRTKLIQSGKASKYSQKPSSKMARKTRITNESISPVLIDLEVRSKSTSGYPLRVFCAGGGHMGPFGFLACLPTITHQR